MTTLNLKQNKKGFVARDFVIATILISGIIALLVLSVNSLATDYSNTNIVDSDFAENFDRFDDDTEQVGEMFDAVSSKEGLDVTGTFELLFSSTFTVINLVLNGVVTTGQQITNFGTYFGIPVEVSRIFLRILVVGLSAFLLFIVLSSVTQRNL